MVTRNGRCWYERDLGFSRRGRFPSGTTAEAAIGYGPGGVVGAAARRCAAAENSLSPSSATEIFTMNPCAMDGGALPDSVPDRAAQQHLVRQRRGASPRPSPRRRGRPVVMGPWIGQRMVAPEPDYAAIARGYGAWGQGRSSTPETSPGRSGMRCRGRAGRGGAGRRPHPAK